LGPAWDRVRHIGKDGRPATPRTSRDSWFRQPDATTLLGGAGVNAPRSDAGWVSARDKLHGRVVVRQPVVEMALPVIAIRWLTDERGAQPRVASKRVRGLPKFMAARRPAPRR